MDPLLVLPPVHLPISSLRYFSQMFACHSSPFLPDFIVLQLLKEREWWGLRARRAIFFIVVIEVIEVYSCEVEIKGIYWMLASQTLNKYLNGSVPIAECHVVSPSPPLRPPALMADGNPYLLACTYLSIHSSSVTSTVATGGEGLDY